MGHVDGSIVSLWLLKIIPSIVFLIVEPDLDTSGDIRN